MKRKQILTDQKVAMQRYNRDIGIATLLEGYKRRLHSSNVSRSGDHLGI